jgi:K+-sensing histidine kinase KdpD
MGLAVSRAIIDAHGGRIWAVPGDSGGVCFALPLDLPAGVRGGVAASA